MAIRKRLRKLIFGLMGKSNAQECLSRYILLGVLFLVGTMPRNLDLNSGLLHGMSLAHALYLDPKLSTLRGFLGFFFGGGAGAGLCQTPPGHQTKQSKNGGR